MKIKINLNKKSVEEAMQKLENVKALFVSQKITDEFLEEVCDWVIKRANEKVYASNIGENVKSDIATHWKPIVSGGRAKITNDSEKAVYVEFGVGVIGQSKPHPRATVDQNYEYNIGSKILDDGSWIFNYSAKADIDIEPKFIIKQTDHSVRTKGQEAVMYAYNAILDAKDDLRNPSGKLQQKWQEIKARYIG